MKTPIPVETHTNVSDWRRIRRFAVPGPAIECATERRLAGDWAGACAAADTVVEIDPDAVRRTYGDAVYTRLLDDLTHLAPDLVRWNMPRYGHNGALAPAPVLLARYGVHTVLHVVPGRNGVRLRLRLGLVQDPRDRNPAQDWTDLRWMWDARRVHEMRDHYGDGTRVPFLRPDGTPLRPEELPTTDPGPEDVVGHSEWTSLAWVRGEHHSLPLAVTDATWRAGIPLAPALLARQIELRSARQKKQRYTNVHFAHEYRKVEVRPRPNEETALALTYGQRTPSPCLAEPEWRLAPEIDLLRAGLTTPEELHPLVRSALCPERGDTGGPVGPRGADLSEPVRVRCRGVWHVVRALGRDLSVPHTSDEVRREEALRALGGGVSGCFQARRAWMTGAGRLPRHLKEHRRQVFLTVRHGDTGGLVRLLDAGLDARVRDASRRSLLHGLVGLDHTVLLPRLLAGGADLDAVDDQGRPPVHTAVITGGSEELVRALVGAGARLGIVDHQGMSLADHIDRQPRKELDDVRDLVVRHHPGIGSGRWRR